ncbi:MAG: RNA 2',3'-cyclic phosphodiesterase [Thermoplasmata archaeon]|nr:RNA 2',3'-cyclic phosphodiesterase [Thermoplasmata archaeon]
MRLFVAVEVPELRLEGLRLGGPEAPAHLTVLFLGDVAEDRAEAIGDRFRQVVRSRPPFALELAGVGVFPNSAHPRVVWVGVGAGAAELGELHDALAGACQELGVSVEARAFVPHVTLRRIRGPGDDELARRWVAEYGAASFGRGRVTELLLKESQLGGGRAVHRTLARLALERVVSPG